MKHSIRSIVILWVFGTSSLWADLASTIREREETIGRLDGEIAAQSQALTRLKSLAESLEKSREEARSLEKSVESIRSECEQLLATREKLITDARTKSLAMRANAEGVRFDTFTTQSGKMYSEVEFKTATDQGVRISHKDGTSTVPPGDLPPMLRQKYGYLLGDAIQAVQARKLPDLSAVSLTAGGATSKDPILAPEIKLGSDGRPISDSTKLMSAKAAEATFKRKQAEALRLKAKPGDKLFQQAVQLEEEAAQIERLLGVPPPRQQPRQ